MSDAEAHAFDADMRRANRKKAVEGRSVIFKIKRCDGPGKPNRWESFKVPVEQGANVIWHDKVTAVYMSSCAASTMQCLRAAGADAL